VDSDDDESPRLNFNRLIITKRCKERSVDRRSSALEERPSS